MPLPRPEPQGRGGALQAAQVALKTATEDQQKLGTEIQSHRLQAAGVEGHVQTHAQLKPRHEQAVALAQRGRELASSVKAIGRGEHCAPDC